jgi:hypothetical protein
MNFSSDDELRVRFEALRSDDSDGAPDFREMLERARTLDAQRRRGVRPLWIVAAAGIVMAVGIALQQTRNRSAGRRADATDSSGGGNTLSISTWKSPTASLLRTSGSEALAPPKVLSSILDGASRDAVQY